MAKIGLVTVLYNSEKVLDEFYDSLNKQEFKDFCLYVINNNSPDKSLEKSKKLAENVFFNSIFIDNKENYGVAKGNNQGINAAINDGCEYILLTNNDIVLENDTISLLYQNHIRNEADLSVPKIYYAGEKKIIWACGGSFNKIKGTTNHFGNMELDNGQYDLNYKVAYSPTCFMLISRQVFEYIGLMDEKFFVYYDDTDFVYRATQKSKLDLWYFYEPVLYHKESFCTGNDSDFKTYYMLRNRIYFAKKHSKSFILRYLINMVWHYTIRYIKFHKNNKTKWNVISKALRDGKKL